MLDKFKKISKNPIFYISIFLLIIIGLVLSANINNDNKNKIHKKSVQKKVSLEIPKQYEGYDNKTDINGQFQISLTAEKGSKIIMYNGGFQYNKEHEFASFISNGKKTTINLDLTKNSQADKVAGFNLAIKATKKNRKTNLQNIEITNEYSKYRDFLASSSSSSSTTETDSSDTSSSANFENLDSTIKSLITDNTDYSDVNVNGSYESEPYTGVITITSNDDVRTVVAGVLGALQKKAGDTLNKFDSIDISVKDKNGNYALKSNYNISTIMSNQQVYRPFKVKDLANTWTEN
ncbi:hypothetical protein ESZ50_01155 [Weissella muntiaci]|uniref:Uncharacterized protein n=1 Tax=Weissella muntiaci TaxID=2508881 RepID=A0A6C2CB66_9LACO|nr:hypothetical protein [Weissella muntiaci]TYC50852.1 hypothetical protein ESZ50_01155 [Weissella muntiaci]